MARKPRRRTWGSGSLEQLRSGWWRIRWREQDGARKTAKYADRGDAEAVLARILSNVRAGKPSGHVAPDSAAAPLLSELADKWLERRQETHRAWRDDQNRWRKHLKPAFGHCRGQEVSQAAIRRFVEAKLAEGLSSTTVGHCVRLLSTFMADVVEQGYATTNPVATLPRATRRLYRNARAPYMKRFLEKREDIGRVYREMVQPSATILAISALAGLRPGEVIALEWGDIDLEARRILVQRQARHGRVGVPKSGHGRVVPIGDALGRALAEWKLATGGKGQLFNPARPGAGGKKGSPPRFISLQRVMVDLRDALKACGLPAELTLYDCGRATFASQWVLGGGSMEKLAKVLGHASVTTTEASYSRMRPEMVRPSELSALDVDLSRPGGSVVDIATARKVGQEMTTVPVAPLSTPA
jgi:integrase